MRENPNYDEGISTRDGNYRRSVLVRVLFGNGIWHLVMGQRCSYHAGVMRVIDAEYKGYVESDPGGNQ